MEAVSELGPTSGSVEDFKIRKHHPRCKKKSVYGCTSKKACGLYMAECMQALQAGVRKLISDIMYFLLLKSFCETFFVFHNLN